MTKYHVRWKLQSAATFESVATTNAETFAHDISGVENGETYDVQVAAENGEGISAYAKTTAVPLGQFDAPQNVALKSGDGKLGVTWKAPVLDGGAHVFQYHVRWKPSAETTFAAKNAATTDVANTSHVIANLQNNTQYIVQVAAENRAKISDYSAKVTATPRAYDLDIDDNGKVTASDGIMVMRFLLGVTGETLARGQAKSGENKIEKIYKEIGRMRDGFGGGEDAELPLDVDGDGEVTAKDGVLIARFLLGLRGGALMRGFDGETEEIKNKIDVLMPPEVTP